MRTWLLQNSQRLLQRKNLSVPFSQDEFVCRTMCLHQRLCYHSLSDCFSSFLILQFLFVHSFLIVLFLPVCFFFIALILFGCSISLSEYVWLCVHQFLLDSDNECSALLLIDCISLYFYNLNLHNFSLDCVKDIV
jgi:hypothetical protein